MILHRSTQKQKDLQGPKSDLSGPAFCVLWTSGPDTARDGVLRIAAIAPDENGEWQRFERICDPSPLDADPEELATSDSGAVARIAEDFGLSLSDLKKERHASEVWEEFEDFLGGRDLICVDALAFEPWRAALRSREAASEPAFSRGATLALCELAALAFPGRLANMREDLVRALADWETPASARKRALEPEELRAALGKLAQRFLTQDYEALSFAARGFEKVRVGFATNGSFETARRISLALKLLDNPATWCPEDLTLPTGMVKEALDLEVQFSEIVNLLEPRCAAEIENHWGSFEKLPPADEHASPLSPQLLERLDQVFEVHLPAVFAKESGKQVSEVSVRTSQHEVAKNVARTLGAKELLLVHAPTGTGKTLAYLIPALMFAQSNGLRVGVATYTRTLQEQAMDREVPRALAALARAGHPGGARISMLKGRENYVCWRALKLEEPDADDEPEAWLAWISLVLFAEHDLDADLDRFPQRAPIALEDSRRYQLALWNQLKGARARTSCCKVKADRETCGAELARVRAQRSHVVITNHSFALARQDFLKHVIFDECEHLHDQAHNAWSHSIRFRELREALRKLHQPRERRSRSVLDRLNSQLLEGTPSHDALLGAFERWEETALLVEQFEKRVDAFRTWRRTHTGGRSQADDHSLFREWVQGSDDGVALTQVRLAATQAYARLESSLAEIVEHLDGLPLRRGPRLRLSIELARTNLSEICEQLNAWLPMSEGQPAFNKRTYFDIEEDQRGETVLSCRVLLPNEFLGRHYYPNLESAALLSATTWIKGSFDSAKGYLGLDSAEKPFDDEERLPSVVRTFKAPDVFDWSRVMICVPRDAPAVSPDKERFLDYARRFIGHLAERTRGRILVLATNASDVRTLGDRLGGFFRARRIPLLYQGMDGTGKEELGELFRDRVDSVLFGVDTFWYGADFPGETLEYVVVLRLPYGVPDRYHHAQCAALGSGDQRKRIYMPRALAKLRQGFGRLMRRESDRGVVFFLDGRIVQPRHRTFLRELPLPEFSKEPQTDKDENSAVFIAADTNTCLERAFEHQDLKDDIARRGLQTRFDVDPPRESNEGSIFAMFEEAEPMPQVEIQPAPRDTAKKPEPEPDPNIPPVVLDIEPDDLPF